MELRLGGDVRGCAGRYHDWIGNMKPKRPRITGGGWSGGPVRDNPGEQRFVLLALIVVLLAVGLACWAILVA